MPLVCCLMTPVTLSGINSVCVINICALLLHKLCHLKQSVSTTNIMFHKKGPFNTGLPPKVNTVKLRPHSGSSREQTSFHVQCSTDDVIRVCAAIWSTQSCMLDHFGKVTERFKDNHNLTKNLWKMQNHHQGAYKLALDWFKFGRWSPVHLKKPFSDTLTFLPILDNFQSIFLCFVKPDPYTAKMMKFSIKHLKVNAAVRKHGREEAEQHKFIEWPKAKKIQKCEDLFCISNLKESGPILMICN